MFAESKQSTSSQTLRPYQLDALSAIKLAWETGNTPLAVLATGLGKTTIIAELLRQECNPLVHRALVFAHTRELVYQPKERIEQQYGEELRPWYGASFAPGIGIVMADEDDVSARIIVATRQSLNAKRLNRVLAQGKIDYVIIDEAHHAAPGSQYLDIVEQIREHNPFVRIAGFTATPQRTDRKALGALFNSICFDYGIVPAIRDGWLAPATRIKIKTDVDMGHIASTGGDYNLKQMEAVLEVNNWVELAVDAYKQYIAEKGRACLAFFPSVEKSVRFTARLQEQGFAAAHIDANTPKELRANILRDYKAGKVQVVANMGVLTEGFDAAHTSAILMARPTRSETLFTQIIGRGLRLWPGKADCQIIDLTVVDTKALEVGTLLGKQVICQACQAEYYKGFTHCPECGVESPQADQKTKTCPECDAEVQISSKLCPECGYIFLKLYRPADDKKGHGNGLREELDSLFNSALAAWHKGSDGYMSVTVGESGALVIVPPSYEDGGRLRDRIQRGHNLLKSIALDMRDELLIQMKMLERMLARAEGYTLYFSPKRGRDIPWKPTEYLRSNSDLASLIAEADVEALKRGTANMVKKSAAWREYLASDGQKNYLRALGSAVRDDITKGEAATLITHILAVRDVVEWVTEDTLAEPER